MNHKLINRHKIGSYDYVWYTVPAGRHRRYDLWRLPNWSKRGTRLGCEITIGQVHGILDGEEESAKARADKSINQMLKRMQP